MTDSNELIVVGGVPAVENLGCVESLLLFATLLDGPRMGVAGMQNEALD
jgi:hypothetical protein